MTSIIDLYSGAGGWDEGLRMLGVTDGVLGIDNNPDACRTAEAAGHQRLCESTIDLEPIDAIGLIASPPCTKFSAAGSRVGRQFMDELGAAVRAILANPDAAGSIRAEAWRSLVPACREHRLAANRKRAKAKRRHPGRIEDAALGDALTTTQGFHVARNAAVA